MKGLRTWLQFIHTRISETRLAKFCSGCDLWSHWGQEESNHFKWAKHIFWQWGKGKLSGKPLLGFSDLLTIGNCSLRFEWEDTKEREGRERFMDRLDWRTDLKEAGLSISTVPGLGPERQWWVEFADIKFTMYNLEQNLYCFLLFCNAHSDLIRMAKQTPTGHLIAEGLLGEA